MIFFGLPDDVGVEVSRSDEGDDGLYALVNAVIPPARSSLRGSEGGFGLLLQARAHIPCYCCLSCCGAPRSHWRLLAKRNLPAHPSFEQGAGQSQIQAESMWDETSKARE